MWLRRKAKIAQNMWQGSTFFFKNCYSWKFEFQWRKICSHLLKKDGSKSISKTIIFILKSAIYKDSHIYWRPDANGDYCPSIMEPGKPFITISELSEIKMFSAKSNENSLKLSELRTKGRNLRLLRSLIVKACVQDCQNPEKAFLHTSQIMAEFACMMLLLKHI